MLYVYLHRILATRTKKIKKPKWHQEPLFSLKRNLENKQKLFEKYSRDPFIRGSFFSALKIYRKARKKKIKEYRSTIIHQLDTLLENDPKKYWSLLEQLTTSKGDNFEIPANDWHDYFKELNQKPSRSNDDILQKFKQVENIKIYSELDNIITNKEIINAIKDLKNKKASSYDLILNEMLKNSQTYILPSLNKLFNFILSTGKFPVKWAKGIIVPIFKSGTKDDPFNYRGLTIGSNI